jgi:hypothetical protein
VSDAADNVSDAVGFTPKTVLVFLIFLAAGPPLGFLLIWATGMIFGQGRPAAPYGLSVYLRTFGFFAIASYIAGGVQALFQAFVASITQAASRTGLVPFRPVFFWIAVHNGGVCWFHDGKARGSAGLGRVVDIPLPACRQHDIVLAGLQRGVVAIPPPPGRSGPGMSTR